MGLVEYFQRRAKNEYIDASRLFVYKATRNYLGWTGDTGAYLRSTAGALALFGAPPERFWPYDIDNFDVEPSAFCYAFGQQFQTITSRSRRRGSGSSAGMPSWPSGTTTTT